MMASGALSADEKIATLQQYKSKFLQDNPGAPVTVVPLSKYYDKLELRNEDGLVVRYAEPKRPSVRLNHHLDLPIDWAQLNSDPELWSYRIHKATAEEVKELSGYDTYKNTTPENDQWIVDIEINIKRYAYRSSEIKM